MRPAEAIDSARRTRVRALESRRDYPGVVGELRAVDRGALLTDPAMGYSLAVALRAIGDREAALEHVVQLHDSADRLGFDRLERRILNLESALRFERGEVDAARRLWERVLELATRADDHDLVAKASNNLGVLHTLQARPAEAIAAFGRARTAYHRLGDRRGLAQAHQNLAINYRETGFGREANAHFREAISHALAADSPDILGRAEEERALLLLSSGDPAMAEAMARRALQRFEAIGDVAGHGESLRVLGQVDLAQGQLERARTRLEAALDHARSASAALLEAETLTALAAVHRRTGDVDRAGQLTTVADEIFARLGASAWGDRLRQRLDAHRSSET